MTDTPQGNFDITAELLGQYAGARGKFKTNMADSADSSVELIEFFRPYKNEVNLYVTNISRRLEKEVVQVRISLCIIICVSILYGQKWYTIEQ